jgi:hypothetical protein
MAQQQDAARFQVFMGLEGGALVFLENNTQVEMVTDAGNIKIDSINNGLSGWSDGSGSIKLNLTQWVPKGGPEFPFQQACADRAYVMVQLGVGTEAYIGIGKILTETVSQSTNAASEERVEWEGEIKPRE